MPGLCKLMYGPRIWFSFNTIIRGRLLFIFSGLRVFYTQEVEILQVF